jgi:hypothetical protein
VAVPVRGIVNTGAVEVTVMCPLKFAPDLGAKVTLNVTLCPGESVSGRFNPLRLNPAPLTTDLEIVTLKLPELVSVSGSVLLLPVCTLPKFKLAGFALSDADSVEPPCDVWAEPHTVVNRSPIRNTLRAKSWGRVRRMGTVFASLAASRRSQWGMKILEGCKTFSLNFDL